MGVGSFFRKALARPLATYNRAIDLRRRLRPLEIKIWDAIDTARPTLPLTRAELASLQELFALLRQLAGEK